MATLVRLPDDKRNVVLQKCGFAKITRKLPGFCSLTVIYTATITLYCSVTPFSTPNFCNVYSNALYNCATKYCCSLMCNVVLVNYACGEGYCKNICNFQKTVVQCIIKPQCHQATSKQEIKKEFEPFIALL